jgi:hypothetical protein
MSILFDDIPYEFDDDDEGIGGGGGYDGEALSGGDAL